MSYADLRASIDASFSSYVLPGSRSEADGYDQDGRRLEEGLGGRIVGDALAIGLQRGTDRVVFSFPFFDGNLTLSLAKFIVLSITNTSSRFTRTSMTTTRRRTTCSSTWR
jgi:hypothetical protein